MDNVPEPEFTACLTVLHQATTFARAYANEAARTSGDEAQKAARHASALVDAIHNIPLILQDWGASSSEEIRRSLAHYQRRGFTTPNLLDIYDEAVQNTDSTR